MSFSTYLLKQNDSRTCGAATLRMLIAITYRDKNLLHYKIDGHADNFLSMIKLAKQAGIILEGRKSHTLKDFKYCKGIFILHLKVGTTNHFVLAKQNRRKIIINDPSGYSYFLKTEDLASSFTLNYLTVKEFAKLKPIVKTLHRRAYYVLPLLLQVMMVGLVGNALYFMDNSRYALLSFICFVGAILVYIIEKHVTINTIKKFDQDLIANKIEAIKEPFLLNFEKIINAKTEVFSLPFIKLTLLTNIIFIILILTVNNPLYLIIVSFLFILGLINKWSSQENSRKTYLLNMKLQTLATCPQTMRHKNYKTVNELSYQLAQRVVYFKIINHFVIALSIFGLMNIANNYSLNFLVFYYFGFIYLFEQINKLLNSNELSTNYHSALNKISD